MTAIVSMAIAPMILPMIMSIFDWCEGIEGDDVGLVGAGEAVRERVVGGEGMDVVNATAKSGLLNGIEEISNISHANTYFTVIVVNGPVGKETVELADDENW